MHRAYLSLGSNEGDRRAILAEAIRLIGEQAGAVVASSSLYETKPQGFVSPHLFLNAVVAIDTTLSPTELLNVTQTIEQTLGRRHKSVNRQWRDRSIDIDLLLYDDLKMESPDLTIPHPLMHLRAFVLDPLSEIAPDLEHPILSTSIEALRSRL